MDNLFQMLCKYMDCQTWDDAERIVRDHPELLDPQAMSLLVSLTFEQPWYIRCILGTHGELLCRCREVGVSQAFAEKLAPLRVIPESLLESLRTAQAAKDRGRLLTLLGDHPELRPALKRGPLFGRETIAPPEFEGDMQQIKRLQEEGCSDPEAGRKEIAAYLNILTRLHSYNYPAFQAVIENDLGGAYIRLGECDRAIECFQSALHFFRVDTVPLEHAFTLKGLGEAYRYCSTGDRAANLQKAISYYEAALRIFTPGAAHEDYSATECCLGVAYLEIPAGDRDKNLERAIDCFQRALPFVRPKTSIAYANLQFNLGEAFRNLSTIDKEVNLRQAIEHYEAALRIHRPNSEQGLYGRIQAGLAAAYRDLAGGTDAEELAYAVKCFKEALRFVKSSITVEEYEALRRDANECYQEWLLLQESSHGDAQVTPTYEETAGRSSEIAQLNDLLRQLMNPSTSLRDRNQLGQRVSEQLANMGGRIVDAEEGKEFEDELNEMRRIQNVLHSDPGAAAALVALAQQTLKRLKPGAHRWVRFHVLTYCGIGYRNLPTGDAGANLTKAIECFEEALKLRSPERAPDEYGPVLNNLGNAYRNLLVGDRTENLSRAIRCFEEAIRLASPQANPRAYGTRQLNLGTAYADLPTGDQDTNLNKAITCYEKAISYLNPETAPLEYAGAHENLGIALLKVASGNRRANMTKALECFHVALRYRPAQSVPAAHAQAQYHLGILYSDLAQDGDGKEKGLAVSCFEAGLQVLRPEHAPRLCAALLCQLAKTKSPRKGEIDLDGEAQAIQYYEKALRLITPESAPREYANAQVSLGSLLMLKNFRELQQTLGVQKEVRRAAAELGLPPHALTVFNQDAAQGMADAVAQVERATHIYNVDTWPRECREMNEMLGKFKGASGHWREALVRFRVALDAAERLYRAGLSERGKTAEAAANAALHRHAAFAAVKAGEVELAWMILERGKTRLLSEALCLGVLRPADVPDDDWSRFVRAAAAVRAIQSDRTGADFATGMPFRTREEASSTAEAALDEAVRSIRKHAPHFLRDTALADVRAQLDSTTVLVAFCVCSFGSMALVVGYEQGGLVAVVDLPSFSQKELDQLLLARRSDGANKDGWLASFREMDPCIWMEAIKSILKPLGELLMRPVVQNLPPGIERLVLLPSGGLALLPLHAALLSEKSKERVCDRFLVSYAPSAEVWFTSRQRGATAEEGGLYQAVNPTEDSHLRYAASEATSVKELIADRIVQHGREVTKEAVITGSRGRAYIHFICHGFYNWAEPRQSGLKLADGDLTLADLQEGIIDLTGSRLVLLSACETGITDVTAGSPDEYVGLPAGFLLARTPCLVSSLWKVSDISTSLLMARFAQLLLAEGRDTVAALALAQRWLSNLPATAVAEYAEECLREEEPSEKAGLIREDVERYRRIAEQSPASRPFAHPYYWAAFTVTGA